MRLVRSKPFWIGFAVGVFAGPVVLGKVAPALKARVPG